MAHAGPEFDELHDVVVIGTGAGGMAAALTAAHHGLDVLMLEKTEYVGGSTAISGGAVWIPENPHLGSVGQTDTREDVVTYLKEVLGNHFRADLIDSFLAAGPEMVTFLENNTAVKFAARQVSPDYQPDRPGAAGGGRTIDPLPFDGRELGPAFALLRPPLDEFLVFGGMMVNRGDIDMLLGSTRSARNFIGAAKLVARFGRDRLSYPRGTRLLMGNALAARLLRSALDKGIAIRRNVQTSALIAQGGCVTGITVASSERGLQRIGARRGVVLATGGFPASAELRARLIPHAANHYSMAPAGNTGDGGKLAEQVGARIAADNIGNAFWAPVSVMQTRDGREIRFPHLILDRPKPGLVAVNQAGKRFVNEATSYHEFVEAMHRSHETTPTIPAFLVCDQRFLRTYGLGLVRPGIWPLGTYIRSGYLLRGGSVAELAQRMGVPADALAQTIARMNTYAVSGNDPEFGKGSNAYNRYLGDAAHKPNPCLGPIDKPPFYAVRVFPGDIGSAAGLVTDAKTRVLDAANQPIGNLYACGNDMNSIMAGAYPSAGITLGPALTFGYIAGKELASNEERP